MAANRRFRLRTASPRTCPSSSAVRSAPFLRSPIAPYAARNHGICRWTHLLGHACRRQRQEPSHWVLSRRTSLWNRAPTATVSARSLGVSNVINVADEVEDFFEKEKIFVYTHLPVRAPPPSCAPSARVCGSLAAAAGAREGRRHRAAGALLPADERVPRVLHQRSRVHGCPVTAALRPASLQTTPTAGAARAVACSFTATRVRALDAAVPRCSVSAQASRGLRRCSWPSS
jgi:hypothetical protein